MTSREGSRSGTGVFYQAMPAVGTDGRNIMKLIPVKMVNGHYVASQPILNKGINESQLPVTLNFNPTPNVTGQKVPLVASAARQFVMKQLPLPSSSHKPGNLAGRCSEAAGLLNKRLPLELPKIAPKVSNSSSLTTQVFDGETSSNVSMPQLPVTVKSPVLPNGQYLQIPPNAQVRSLPASALPPAIKKQIFSVAQCASNSKLPNVLYVSPVTTMNQCVTEPGSASGPAPAPTLSLKRLSRASGTVGSSLSSNSKAREDRERPNSPMKWVIEEEAGSSGSCLVPVNSPSMASDILQALAKRESPIKPVEHAPLQPSSPNTVQRKDNALVMYSGKVYFVSKKFDLSPKPQVAALKTGSWGVKPSPTNKTMQDKKQTVNPVVADEVIDLCDDDPLYPAATAAPGSSASQSDEDNVIFVSYVPPASVSGSGHQSIKTAHVNSKTVEQNRNNCQKDLIGQGIVASLGVTDSLSVKTCKDVDTVHNKVGCPVSAETMSSGNVVAVQVKKISPTLQLHRDGSHSEATIKHDSQNDQTIDSSEHRNTGQPTENTELSSLDGGAAPDSSTHSGSCVQMENVGNTKESCLDPIKENQTSVTGLEILHACDRQLKKMFGITSDIKVCLTKVDGVNAKAAPIAPPQIESTTKHTLEGIRKLIQEANIEVRRRKRSEMTPTKNVDSFPGNSKKLKMAESKSTVNSPSILNPQLDTHPAPQEQTKSLGSPSSLSEIIHDYEEPINEDVISTPVENHGFSLSPPPLAPLAPAFVPGPCCVEDSEQNMKPRRRGRPKRCTVCPCGAPDIVTRPAHANVVKQKGHRPPRNNAGAMTTPCLKNEGTPIKDKRVDEKVVPMVIHSPSATLELNYNSEITAEIPVSNNFHTTAMDAEEILSLERIERLKELLKEKESALELIRNNIN